MEPVVMHPIKALAIANMRTQSNYDPPRESPEGRTPQQRHDFNRMCDQRLLVWRLNRSFLKLAELATIDVHGMPDDGPVVNALTANIEMGLPRSESTLTIRALFNPDADDAASELKDIAAEIADFGKRLIELAGAMTGTT